MTGKQIVIRIPHRNDIARIRDWFRRLSERVRAVDFTGARPIFAEDMIGFGAFENLITGRDAAERAQWRNVGMGVFDSTGYHEDGTPYDRPGHATIAFSRQRIGDDWVADHTHMSLFRDGPTRSFGKKVL